MDTRDVSDIPSYIQLLERHKQHESDAQAHKGQRMDTVDPVSLVQGFLSRVAATQKIRNEPDTLALKCSFIPPSYPPSTIPLKDLRKVKLSQLLLETHNRGVYVLVRSITTADRMATVIAIVQDEYGTAITLQLCMQELESKRTAKSVLPKGATMIVKEPFLKKMGDDQFGLRVDHPSDLVFLPSYDLRIPGFWKSDEQHGLSWQAQKEDADELVRSERYHEAIRLYDQLLHSASKGHTTDAIRLNRALALLKTEQFDATLAELAKLDGNAAIGEKALYRKGMALYGLAEYRACSEVLTELCLNHPNNAAGKSALNRSIARLKEQRDGVYDFGTIREEALKLDIPILDHASYVGPVEVRNAPSKGRGLFTTKSVKAGDILLCEKAFVYEYVDINQDLTESSILVNAETKRITVGGQARLLVEVIAKLHKNPSLIRSVTDLHYGDYKSTGSSPTDAGADYETIELPIVDSFLVDRICTLNVFGCPRTSRDTHKPISMIQFYAEERLRSFGTCGLWIRASYINHDCHCNSRRSFLGNMMILRATRDMPADTEITFWYKTPTGRKQEGRLDHWGFECGCAICQDTKDTPDDIVSKRKTLRDKIESLKLSDAPTNVNKLRVLVKAIEETYKRPAREVPRLSLWDAQLNLAYAYTVRKNFTTAVEFAIATLNSLGYEIEGGIPLTPVRTLRIKTWGIMEDQLVDCWLLLANLYSILEPHRVDTAMYYAKITYKCCVGEDNTFKAMYGGQLP